MLYQCQIKGNLATPRDAWWAGFGRCRIKQAMQLSKSALSTTDPVKTRKIDVETVIAGQVMHIRTTVEQP